MLGTVTDSRDTWMNEILSFHEDDSLLEETCDIE